MLGGGWHSLGLGVGREEMRVEEMENTSPMGRLLEELSWEGNARKYRGGGRGLENVLVTEVFSLLDQLPRSTFLGAVLTSAHGADRAREAAVSRAEEAVVDLLPGGPDLAPGGPNIQPDGYLHLPDVTVLMEAKRIRQGAFQAEQLAREYLSLLRDHDTEHRLLLLVLPAPPPVLVRGMGRLAVREAILTPLTAVHARAAAPPPLQYLVAKVDEAVAWLTWSELASVVREQAGSFQNPDASVTASIMRMASALDRAVRWHS